LTAYIHAWLKNHLAPTRFHISAVLDDDERSVLCACVGFVGLCSLVLLELCRNQHCCRLRTCLAAACGSGIVLCCTVRESAYVNAHRGTAVLALGAAVALVWVVSSLSRDPRSRRSAAMLVALLVLTGSAQALNIVLEKHLGPDPVLPSWALGSLELGLCASPPTTERYPPPCLTCLCACAAAGSSASPSVSAPPPAAAPTSR